MAASASITLHIGKAIPQGNENETRRIIGLWQEIEKHLKEQDFAALDGINGTTGSYRILLDASELLQRQEEALTHSGSFTAYQKAQVEQADLPVDAKLHLQIHSTDGELKETESYQVATIFLQQLVLLANIIAPGSIQILDARYIGPGAHRYEAQNFDSRVMHGALRASVNNEWPPLKSLKVKQVWAWLEQCETSQTDTAIADQNKVLFTLLKVAEQRQEYSARTVLLVLYQLEVLLACRYEKSPARIRNRLQMVLGKLPEAADCFVELYEVRHSLFHANQPVHRPPLICHTTAKAQRKQLGQHNTAVESGTILVLALLQDMIESGTRRYEFHESLNRKTEA